MKLKFDLVKHGLLLCLLSLSSFAFAQRTVMGTITDADSGDALIGASVLAKGSDAGTVTDIDGKYSLEVPSGVTELEISYTGFSTQTVTLGASNVVNINLAPGALLDEVVVIGYGSVKKKDATGAVVGVSEKDFNQGVIASPEQLIQGRAAGVQITSSSGEPGAGINVRIRGTSSVRNGNNPLFVVDGVPLSGDTGSESEDIGVGTSAGRNPLNFLNPNDIASVDILKDASATAIYGSRGANGVVLITTKSGRGQEGTLNYNYSLGISNISKKYDILGADEYLDAWQSYNPTSDRSIQDLGSSTDWQDEILRTGITHNHNVTYGGGDAFGNYRFSVGYQDQEGIIENSALQRLTARFNGDRKFWSDKLKISTQLTISDVHDDNVPITQNSGFEGDLMAAAIKFNPTAPVYEDDGVTPFQLSIAEASPRAMLDYTKSFTNTIAGLASVTGALQLTNDLSFTTRVGYNRSYASRKDAFSRLLKFKGVEGQGRLFNTERAYQSTLWENFLTYDKGITSNIDLNAIVGYSYQDFQNSFSGFEMTYFRTDDLDIMINNAASVDVNAGTAVVPINSNFSIDELQSYYGRLNLSFMDKYLLTGTVRADGSTRFGTDNSVGIFPAFAFKWKIGNEGFLPASVSDLGLRLGYGITGNQEFDHNVHTERDRYANWDIDQTNINGGGVEPVAFANPGLKWESTTQINAGLDFAFMDYKLSGSLDFYTKNTNDLLVKLRAAQPAPNSFVWTNLDADVINSGVELGLNYAAVDNGKFTWNIIGNVAYNTNVVKNLDGLIIDTGTINGQGLSGAFAQRIADDQPLYAFFLREFDGYGEGGAVQNYVGGDVQKFVDASPLPTWNVGLTNSFTFGDFSFGFFFTGQFGHYIYSNTGNAFFTAGSIAGGRNVSRDVIGNGEARTNSPDVSTRFLEKGDFLRLQNVNLGYNLRTNNDYISNVRLFVNAQNLAVFTNYSGQDPEVNVNKAIDGVPSFGIDYTTYPRARTITLGANVSF